MTAHRPPDHDGVLERTAEGGFIRFRRRLEHPVAAVWEAITDPARLAEWWLPFEAEITVDLRVGGEIGRRSPGTGIGSPQPRPGTPPTVWRRPYPTSNPPSSCAV